MSATELADYDYVVIDSKASENKDDLIELAQQSSFLIIPTRADSMSAVGLPKTIAELVSKGISNYAVLIVANEGTRGEELREQLSNNNVSVFTTIVRKSAVVLDLVGYGMPLEGLKNNVYARRVVLDYGSVMREVLKNV